MSKNWHVFYCSAIALLAAGLIAVAVALPSAELRRLQDRIDSFESNLATLEVAESKKANRSDPRIAGLVADVAGLREFSRSNADAIHALENSVSSLRSSNYNAVTTPTTSPSIPVQTKADPDDKKNSTDYYAEVTLPMLKNRYPALERDSALVTALLNKAEELGIAAAKAGHPIDHDEAMRRAAKQHFGY